MDKRKSAGAAALNWRRGTLIRGQNIDPWSNVIPLQRLIPVIFKTLSTSQNIPHFQLVSVGNMIISFMKEIDKLESNSKCKEKKELLRILDILYDRMTKNLQPEDGLEEFTNNLLDLSNLGLIDFNGTAIQTKLMQVNPKSFKEILLESLIKSCPQNLINSCQLNCENFHAILHDLHNLFKQSGYHSKIVEFSKSYLNLVKESKERHQTFHEFVYLFPSKFHTIIYFNYKLMEISNTNTTANESLSENLTIRNIIFELLNELYLNSHCKEEISFVSFFIIINSQIFNILNSHKNEIKLSEFPKLWVNVNKNI